MSTIAFDNVRLVSPGGIRHKVVDGVTMSGDEESLTAELGLVIQTSDWEEFLEEMFPTPVFIGDLVSLAPRLYLANAPYLRLKSFRTSAVIPGKPMDIFNADPNAHDDTYGTLMRVDLSFATMQEDDENPPDEGNPESFLEVSLNAGAEILQIPPSNLLKVSERDLEGSQNQPYTSNEDKALAAYKLIPTVEWSLKWKFALNPDWDTIFDLLGCVNSTRLSLFKNARAETVLFTGISGQRSFRYFRRRAIASPWNLDFKFSQRHLLYFGSSFGWNHVYSPKKKKFVKLGMGIDGTSPIYQGADLMRLFRAGS